MTAKAGRRTPPALAIPAAAAVAFLFLPLAGVLARTPWSTLADRLSSPEVLQALTLSLTVSAWALVLSLVLGVPLAWLLARVEFPGKALVRCLVMLPMVLPPTVAGVALLQGYGRRGIAGPWLEAWFGITLPFTTPAAVLASAFVSMPFLVISLEGALAGLHPPLRGDGHLPGREPAAGLRHDHAPHGRSGPHRGHRPVLGPRAGRVRRDDHLRGQSPGHHPDPAAPGLPPPPRGP
ncbi:hypothetical protein GCM10020000_27660 [Streptomyces olivoverticillatus]